MTVGGGMNSHWDSNEVYIGKCLMLIVLMALTHIHLKNIRALKVDKVK